MHENQARRWQISMGGQAPKSPVPPIQKCSPWAPLAPPPPSATGLLSVTLLFYAEITNLAQTSSNSIRQLSEPGGYSGARQSRDQGGTSRAKGYLHFSLLQPYTSNRKKYTLAKAHGTILEFLRL